MVITQSFIQIKYVVVAEEICISMVEQVNIVMDVELDNMPVGVNL